jgi:hypothetical protein
VIDRRSGEWADTHMFIFWDGCWRWAGNLGGPYYDWRESETFFIKELLRNLI